MASASAASAIEVVQQLLLTLMLVILICTWDRAASVVRRLLGLARQLAAHLFPARVPRVRRGRWARRMVIAPVSGLLRVGLMADALWLGWNAWDMSARPPAMMTLLLVAQLYLTFARAYWRTAAANWNS